MGNVQLEKPSLATGDILQGGAIGTTGTDFFIKAARWKFANKTIVREVTGDGDDKPKFEHNNLLYTEFIIDGFMVGDQALGLANLVDSDKNPVTSLVVNLGPNRSLTLTPILESMTVEATRIGVFNRVVLVGKQDNVHIVEG
jgi:hypothetical protein